jgi:hypothetical protein
VTGLLVGWFVLQAAGWVTGRLTTVADLGDRTPPTSATRAVPSVSPAGPPPVPG